MFRGSIVAVHGFGGPLHTWTHDVSGKLWLRDFLPKDLPGARIMSFGYDSMVVNSKSVHGMIESVGDLLLQLRYRRLSPEVWIHTPETLYETPPLTDCRSRNDPSYSSGTAWGDF